MARFVVGQSITTREPVIEVDGGLRPGKHRFQLQVQTSDERKSEPDTVVVEVRMRIG